MYDEKVHTVKVVSTVNGVRVSIGVESMMLFTSEVAELVDCLNKSLRGCGEWNLSFRGMKPPTQP